MGVGDQVIWLFRLNCYVKDQHIRLVLCVIYIQRNIVSEI